MSFSNHQLPQGQGNQQSDTPIDEDLKQEAIPLVQLEGVYDYTPPCHEQFLIPEHVHQTFPTFAEELHSRKMELISFDEPATSIPYDLPLGVDSNQQINFQNHNLSSPFSPASPTFPATTGQWPPQVQFLTREEDAKEEITGTGKIRTAAGQRRVKQAVYPCQFAPSCHATFTARHNLQYHLNAHLGLKPYKCSKCEYSTSSPATKTRHENTCRGYSVISGMDAPYAPNVIDHLNAHLGLKPYKCSKCEYSTSSPAKKTRHEKTCRGYSVISGMDAPYAPNVIDHLNAHLGLKPYKCSKCEYSTSSPATKTRHEKSCRGYSVISGMDAPYAPLEIQLRRKCNETQHSGRSTRIEDVQDAATEIQENQKRDATQNSSQSISIEIPEDAVTRNTRTQLFVGNLPYQVGWQDLADLFRRAGTVLHAAVSLHPDNRSRGYGAVLLASAEEAGRAIDMFNGFSWQTRILEVRPYGLSPDLGIPTWASTVTAQNPSRSINIEQDPHDAATEKQERDGTQNSSQSISIEEAQDATIELLIALVIVIAAIQAALRGI